MGQFGVKRTGEKQLGRVDLQRPLSFDPFVGSESEQMKPMRKRGGSHLMQRRFNSCEDECQVHPEKQKQYLRVSEAGVQVFSLDSL